MADPTFILLIVLLPLIGGLLAFVLGNRWAGWTHVLSSLVVLILALLAFLGLDEPVVWQVNWFQMGWTQFEVSIWYDELAAIMTLVVSIVALMVALFSTEYMKHDEGRARYFGFLGLFAFSMYGIVLSGNLLITFIFWELVGFSSYLLIGFWYQKDAPPKSSFKAFIMNRIGDGGFLLGLFVIYAFFKTFDIQEVLGLAHEATELGMTPTMLYVMGIGLFLAAVGKSAQFPLQTWLPDAMTGPTPVSALIHAATMVAAGVYLMVRVFYLLLPDVLHVIAIAGGLTAFMGAFAAFAQNDIKKVLAYSTVSQLGYMILAVGCGFPLAAFFHLVTHAFFKAGLFLCSGSVIHYFHETVSDHGFDAQDIRNMGGLRSALPITFWVFTICMLALAGLPLFSGYLSKEMVLAGMLNGANVPFIIVLFGFGSVFMTAAYMSRLYFHVFFGKKKPKRFNESMVVKMSLVVLGALSLGAVFSINPFHPDHSWLVHYLSPVVRNPEMLHFPFLAPLSIGLALLGLFISYLYVERHLMETQIEIAKRMLYRLSRHHFYQDIFYRLVVARAIVLLADLTYWFDKKVIDRFVDGVAYAEVIIAQVIGWIDDFVVDGLVKGLTQLIKFSGERTRKIQGGNVQYYFVWALLGVLLIFYFMN